MKYLVVGEDFKLGYKGKGTCEYLQDHAEQFGYEMNVIKCAMYDDEKISSTLIRKKIMDGKIETANKLLGHDYFFDGRVVAGKRIGHKIGIPTLNIVPDERKVMPPKGVYAARCQMSDGRMLEGIANFGVNPTIADNNRLSLEMNLFNYDGVLYEQEVEIHLKKFIRPERRFESLEALRIQVLKDIDEVKELFEKDRIGE